MLRPHLRICLAAFVLDFAVMIGITAVPFFVMQHLGGSAPMLGLFAGIQAAVYAFTCLASSTFVARTRNGLRYAIFGVALYMFAMTTVPFLKNPYLCCAAAALSHLALAFVWPALHSWVGAEPDDQLRAKRMATFNVSWSFGFAISPLVGGPLYDADYRLPFAALFLLCIYALYLITTLPHEKAHYAKAIEQKAASGEPPDDRAEAFLLAAWCATGVANVLANVTRSVFTERVAQLVEKGQLRLLFESNPAAFLQHSAATKYSWMAFALAAATAATFLILGHFSRWKYRMGWIFLMQAAAGGAFWLLGNTNSLMVMLAAFAVVGINLGGSFFASTYYSLANPLHKHRRAAINEGAVGIGGILTAGFGFVVAAFGFQTAFRAIPAALLVAIVCEMLLVSWGKRRAQKNALKPSSPDKNSSFSAATVPVSPE